MGTRFVAVAFVVGLVAFGCAKKQEDLSTKGGDSLTAQQVRDSILAANNQAAPAGGAAGTAATVSDAERGTGKELGPGSAPRQSRRPHKPTGGHDANGGGSAGSGSGATHEPKAPVTRYATVPVGTAGVASLNAELSSETAKEGDLFTATIGNAIVVDGAVAVPAGAKVHGHVTGVNSTGRGKSKAMLALAFDQLELDSGAKVDIAAKPFSYEAGGNTKGDVVKTGAGALIGGLIGSAAGDAKKGAVIGGAAGAGLALSSRGEPVVLALGHKFGITLTEPVKVPVK